MAGGGGGSGFGPGLWVADIEKVYQGEYWTNRYIVAAPDLPSAVAIASQIVGIERAIYSNVILVTRYRVSDGQPDTDVYQVINVNLFGNMATPTTDLLPLFVVARFDFNTAGGGRPSRKYIRGTLTEGGIAFNTITPTTVTFLDTTYAAPLVALAGFVDVDGQEIVSGSVFPQVSMRQLRRGSKRKAPATGTPL